MSSKILICLSSGGIMELLSDGSPPYAEARLLDCQNGEAGDIYEFGEEWRPLLHEYFGGKIPEWVVFSENVQGERPERADYEREFLLRRVASDIAKLRKISADPFSIPVTADGKVDIELKPEQDDNGRVVVIGCRTLGDTVVNYTDDGLVIDVYPDGDIYPVGSMSFAAEDLRDKQASSNFDVPASK